MDISQIEKRATELYIKYNSEKFKNLIELFEKEY